MTARNVTQVTSLTESVVRYAVWEREPDGSTRSCQEAFGSQAIAEQTAAEYNAEEAELFATESGGPVAPKPPSRFLVVKETTTFEAVE